MPSEYTLYYWAIPFRGHFVRYVLAHAGAQWNEPPTDELVRLKGLPVADQPLPLMAPPFLHDRNANVWISQLGAILTYLGEKHDLMPSEPEKSALTHKIIGDAGDVLEEITCNCGEAMWTQSGWDDFSTNRLPRWMEIFEETGRRNGLARTSGYMLGTPQPSLADFVTAALWFTMIDKVSGIAPLLERHSPATAALSHRIAETPAIADMRHDCDMRFGNAYCGGEIERSLRDVVGT